MKKIISTLFIISLIVTLGACSNSKNNDTAKEVLSSETVSTEDKSAVDKTEDVENEPSSSETEDVENEPSSSETEDVENEPSSSETEVVENKLSLGETASTDIIDFTLEDAQFTYYVSNSSTNYVEPTDEPNSMFAASIGHCFVSATFTITNKDRGGKIDFAGFGSSWTMNSWELTYNGEKYKLKGFNLNGYDTSPSLSYSALVDKETGNMLVKNGTSNKLIGAGESYTFRTFFIVDFDPESLTDSFDFSIKVPNSKAEYENFTYHIA